MTTRNRRRAERIEVGMPAQVYTQRGFIEARLCDLSRTGLRMRVRIADLGMRPTEDHALANKRVLEVLAPHFALDLDHKRYGPLLQREVELRRVALVPDAPLFVDLCAEFDEPLDDELLGILRADLPPLREDRWTPELVDEAEPAPEPAEPEHTPSVPVLPLSEPFALEEPVADEKPVARAPSLAERAAPKRPAPKPAARPRPRPASNVGVSRAVPAPRDDPRAMPQAPMRHRYRALVTGSTPDAPPAFFCHTDLVTLVGVRVRIPRPPTATDIRSAMTNLIRSHGSIVDLQLNDANAEMWAGPARVTGVELPPAQPDIMLVTLAFARPLSMATMRRFGILAA